MASATFRVATLCWNLFLAILPSAAGSCPAQWLAFEGHCYRAYEGPADWDQARAACESYGAALASIHSQAENDHCLFACGNVRPFHQGCWIGGTDRHPSKRNVWIWVDGSPFDWSKWFDHGGGNKEPNNDFCTDHRHCRYGHTSDCNVLEVSKPFKGHWLDTFCTDRLKFICKVDDSDAAQEAVSAASQDWEEVPRKSGAPLPSPPRPAVAHSLSPAAPPLPVPPAPPPQPQQVQTPPARSRTATDEATEEAPSPPSLPPSPPPQKPVKAESPSPDVDLPPPSETEPLQSEGELEESFPDEIYQ